MDVEKIFHDLESNRTQEYENSKKKLVELFTQYKDQWLVHYMMDYFVKTGSQRIIEVLVRAQFPHDIYILDRIDEWLKTQTHRVQALNIFSFVVRKHPTWLYKVEKHRLIKDIFKLLLTEKEIVPLMNALLSIIMLLPIIPNSVPNILNDLFDVFGHLASWNCQNPNRLTGDKLVHLQLGLQMLFHRLYGMYPCNFLGYLSEFVKKDKDAIFYHTIKPLLETVRVHPMLVIATTDSEISNSRWKEKEPHDVVEECEKLSLPVMRQDLNTERIYPFSTLEIVEGTSDLNSRTRRTDLVKVSYQLKDHIHRGGPLSRINGEEGNIWSPYNEITTSGPISLTPTPSYMLTLPSSAASNANNHLVNVTGSSPPEAAVEATPETTPMKDAKELKAIQGDPITAATSSAVRAIFPSSDGAGLTSGEASTREITRTSSYDRRLQEIKNDRTQAKQGIFRSPTNTAKCDTPDLETDIPLAPSVDSSSIQLHTSMTTPIVTPTATPTPTLTPIPTDCNGCDETEGSMCTVGGLQIPTSRSMQILLVKSVKKRKRMASYCYTESSWSQKGGSKKDANSENTFLIGNNAKVRRAMSCPTICCLFGKILPSTEAIETVDFKNIENIDYEGSNHSLQKSSKMLSIANATKKANYSYLACSNVATQTIETYPSHYENTLYEILLEEEEFRKAYERKLQYPSEVLDQLISKIVKENPDIATQEQYQLLYLHLLYERYRREIHAERNRRLMGRSRHKRSLENERDCLREKVENYAKKNENLIQQIDEMAKSANIREQAFTEELMALNAKYQCEVEVNKCLRQTNENLQARLNEELANRKDVNYELESLRGQILNMKTELQHAQVQSEIGLQCKQELARLESEFIVMGEVQIKCRDRLSELENYKTRDEEISMLQQTYNTELKDLRHTLEEKSSQLDSAKHKIIELQTQQTNNEKVITDQKRLLKAVKDEYEEGFKALNKKYDVQKIVLMQMEGKIMMSLHKAQTSAALNACSPDTDKTDIGSSMDRNSPLSTSLASSESLSASIRSTELRNLQQMVEMPIPEAHVGISLVGDDVMGAGANIIEGRRLPAPDLASSASTAISTAGVGGGAINIASLASSSNSAIAAHDYDLQATISHIHPHVHLQHQQQQQQQQRHQQQTKK